MESLVVKEIVERTEEENKVLKDSCTEKFIKDLMVEISSQKISIEEANGFLNEVGFEAVLMKDLGSVEQILTVRAKSEKEEIPSELEEEKHESDMESTRKELTQNLNSSSKVYNLKMGSTTLEVTDDLSQPEEGEGSMINDDFESRKKDILNLQGRREQFVH